MHDLSQVILLREAADDLDAGRLFYDRTQIGIGDYFYDSLIADVESLYLFAGVHATRCGYHCMFAKRFPFAIYYELSDGLVIVVAIFAALHVRSVKKLGLGAACSGRGNKLRLVRFHEGIIIAILWL